jgi:hypothetical protein
VPPVIVKPLPEIDSALMISGSLPDEVSVTDCVFEVLGWTVPKLRVAGLIVRPGIPAVISSALPAEFRTSARPEIASEHRTKANSPARLAKDQQEIWVGEPPAKERRKEGARQHLNIKTPQGRFRTRRRFALARLLAATPSELTHESVVERSVKRYPIICRKLFGCCAIGHIFFDFT